MGCEVETTPEPPGCSATSSGCPVATPAAGLLGGPDGSEVPSVTDGIERVYTVAYSLDGATSPVNKFRTARMVLVEDRLGLVLLRGRYSPSSSLSLASLSRFLSRLSPCLLGPGFEQEPSFPCVGWPTTIGASIYAADMTVDLELVLDN